jgi:NADH-quinone oxidoreductase subunit A
MNAPSPLTAYLPILLLFALAGVMGVLLSYISAIIGPRRPSAVKSLPFECGSPNIGSARERFAVKFYVVALLFIVFDVEAVFLYPWAVLFRELAWPGFFSMGIFVLTLLAGLAYVWMKGALDWES